MKFFDWMKLIGLAFILALAATACAGAAPPEAAAPTAAPEVEEAVAVTEEPAAAVTEEVAATEEAAAAIETEQAAEEPAAAGAEENVLTIGIPGDIETLDPSYGAAEMANTVLKNIYDQPVRYVRKETPDGYTLADVTQFEGVVWESFELQPDEVTYKIKVRPGMQFPETGNEITAETIKYKFERAFGIGVSDQWVANTAGVSSLDQVTVDGPYDLTIKLNAPNPLFLPLMRDQDFGIVDPEAINEHTTADDTWGHEWLAKNYAGSGEFVVESWTSGVEMVLQANPDYWAGKACFDRVVLKVIPDSANRALLLSQGAIDIATNLSVDEVESLQGTEGVKILSIPSRNQVLLGLNNAIAPFDNVQVRQALSYAVPYEQIVEDVFTGQGAVSQSSMPRLAQGFDPNFWPYSYDPEKAKALLEEAGMADGFSFKLSIPVGDAEMEGVAVVLQSTFRDIGVEMEIEKLAAGPFFEGLSQRSHQAWMRTALNYVDDPFYHLFLWYKTDTVINWFKYSNERVDEITDLLATELDPQTRKDLASEAQQIINEEVPALYVGELNFLLAMRDDISGFVLEPDHLLSFYELCREGN
jgi:peptide/nickel transport system substrate-binding protein